MYSFGFNPLFAIFLNSPSLPPELKNWVGLGLIVIGTAGATVAMLLSQRMRDLALFFMTAFMVWSERLDINFLSHEWYRGTTRGIEFSLFDLLAIGLLVSSLLAPRHRSRFYWPASLGLMLLYLLDQGFSIVISEPKIYGLFEITKTMRAILLFVAVALYLRTERELRLLVLGLVCPAFLEGLLALKHHFLLGMERANGTFDSANSLSIYLCMTTPVLVAAANSLWSKSMRYLSTGAILLGAVGVLLSVSRAGIPIFALVVFGTIVFCSSWRITLQKIAMSLVACLGIALLALLTWGPVEERYSQSNLQADLSEHGYESRGQYFALAQLIVADHFLGVGLNNWSYWVSKVYGPKIGAPYEDYDEYPPEELASMPPEEIPNFAPAAHSLGVITISELGVPGFVLFSLLWLRWFSMGLAFLWRRRQDPMYRLGVGIFFGICGVFLQSQTEWIYRETDILMTFHILLGALASMYFLKIGAGQWGPELIKDKDHADRSHGRGWEAPAPG